MIPLNNLPSLHNRFGGIPKLRQKVASLPFQTKLQVFFIALFIAVQSVTILVVNGAVRNHFQQQSTDSLRSARSHVRQAFIKQQDLLLNEATTLLRNEVFARAIISANERSIRQAITEADIDLDSRRLLLVGSTKRIFFDSDERLETRERFFHPDLLDQADKDGFSSGFMVDDSDVFVVSFVPVQLTDLVIWMGLATPVTAEQLDAIRKEMVFPVNLTLLISETDSNSPTLNVTTLPFGELSATAAMFKKMLLTKGDEVSAHYFSPDKTVVASIDNLDVLPGGTQVLAGIQFTVEDALGLYEPMFHLLTLIAIAGSCLALVGCVFVARAVTVPIRMLDEAVIRIAGGDFTERVEIAQKNEIGRLGSALNQMMKGLRAREQEVEYRLTHDGATGLPNREYFEQTLTDWINLGQPHSIVLVDIARFSEINNILGHEKGDQLIVEFSARLKSMVTNTDFVARLTGKSFVIGLLAARESDVIEVAQRIINGLEAPFTIDQESVDIAVYMGVSHFPAHGGNTRTLLRKAEIALDEAHHEPLRYAIYDKNADPYKPESLSLMGELRQGLKNGEFFFEYQPKLDLGAGVIKSCEALIRWNHPRLGRMYPDMFIELAERSGYIGDITLWGIDEAMRQQKTLQAEGIDVKVAVNLSVKDIQYRQFTHRIQALIDSHQIDPCTIQLEITETGMMARPNLSLDILNKLDAMGFVLVIDDYGVGYSSMAYIKKLPVREIKIDQSFVTDMLNNEEDGVIVKSTIDMAHSLGLKLTAEGPEDEATLAHLNKIGCDYAQGYVISKPLELDDFIAFVKSYEVDQATG